MRSLPIRRSVSGHPLAALLLVLALPAAAAAQGTASVSGRVAASTGAPLQGVTVAAVPAAGGPARRTATTDSAGAYRLAGLAPGAYRLRATRLGFEPAEREVALAAGRDERVDFRLAESTVMLDPVEARSRRDTDRERARFETEAGVTARVIGGGELKVLPGLGEADVLRAVEVLPGVVTTSDFSSAFNVRGGSADQNLILLDGFPIFNPFHLGGLFSVFNADVVARAELLAGGFGAEYGGRVSSVLTVETQPDTGRLGGAAGVSLLASRLALHASLPRGVAGLLGGSEGSWLLSARRSYFDAVLGPVVDFPYHLTDVQLGAVLGTAGGGRVRLTAYTGEDVLDLSDFDPPGDEDDGSILRIRWNWGNDVAGIRWEQPLGSRWLADTRAGFSRYAESLTFADFGDTRFGSRIEQLSLRTDLARALGPELTVKTGAELSRLSYANFGEAGGTSFFDASRSGVLASGYGQLRWARGQAWIAEPGLRADVWTADGHTRTQFSPRLAVKRFFGAQRDGAVKLAVGRYVQFVHSLRDEQLPVSNDTWVTSDADVPPVVSDQVQLGIEKFWGERWYASLEGYYRGYRGVTDFNVADDPNDPTDDLLEGDGFSYGLDLLVRRTAGRLTGWAAVSLLKAERTFPDPTVPAGLEGIPTTVTFPPVFDRRVDVDVVLQYRLPWGVESGLRWNYGSGVPYSRPVAQFVGFETDLVVGGYRVPRAIGDDDEVPFYVVPGERNRERYPAYHRLDLTFRREYRRRWGTLTPYLQVLNAYNRKNVLFYFYNYDQAPPTRAGISMFPVLPTIGLEATF